MSLIVPTSSPDEVFTVVPMILLLSTYPELDDVALVWV
ncbi:MAG: hypothetical protein QOG48_835 [Verrucomicrobiota bacterium]